MYNIYKIYLYMEFNTSNIIMATRKVIAYAHSKIRAARGGNNPPMIVTIPKEVAEKSGMKLGDDIQILTDGEKIVIRKTEVPEI
jgi:AbrB family looped-hinge helix DNA binding protein